MFNILSENNDFGFNSVQKINIWTNLIGPTSLMLHTKSQGHLPSGSGEEDF